MHRTYIELHNYKKQEIKMTQPVTQNMHRVTLLHIAANNNDIT